jgi:murein DD-endopeptidase MepM/ murein hydrolase activator NlpD
MLRFVARVLVVAALIAFATVTATTAVDAAPLAEEDRFVMSVFPHDTTAVNFWDSWAARRSGGRSHKGIDIMSPRGTEILAVADGTVTAFGSQHLSGYFVQLDHGEGWTTTYMHLNNDTLGTDDGQGGSWTAIAPTLTVGDEVRAGEVIGYVGDSGNAEGTQPHTHFEIRTDGEKTNPYSFLKDAWDRERRLLRARITPL